MLCWGFGLAVIGALVFGILSYLMPSPLPH
jgi:hypothetical protein